MSNTDLSILSAYPEEILAQVRSMIEHNQLETYLKKRYPETHQITSNKALFSYVQEVKKRYMKKAAPIHKVLFDDKIDRINKALGLHSFVSGVQGNKLKAKSEIRIASLFKKAPAVFLEMIVVHELAHLKEKDHNKSFYSLCDHMINNYSQLEFDLRLYLLTL